MWHFQLFFFQFIKKLNKKNISLVGDTYRFPFMWFFTQYDTFAFRFETSQCTHACTLCFRCALILTGHWWTTKLGHFSIFFPPSSRRLICVILNLRLIITYLTTFTSNYDYERGRKQTYEQCNGFLPSWILQTQNLSPALWSGCCEVAVVKWPSNRPELSQPSAFLSFCFYTTAQETGDFSQV